MMVYGWTIMSVGFALLFAKTFSIGNNDQSPRRSRRFSLSGMWYFIAAVILIVVAGLRWGVGTDFFSYVRLYPIYKVNFLNDLKTFDEPGAKGLAWLVSYIYDDPSAFFFGASLLTIGSILWAYLRYSNAIAFSYLLFIFIGIWHGSFNGVRQFLACAVLIAGHRFIIDRKFGKYCVIVLIAAAFHQSAFAMLVLYLIPNKKLGGTAVFGLLGLAVVAFYASDAVLDLIQWVKEDVEESGYAIRTVNPVRVAVAIAPLAFYWTSSSQPDEDSKWFYRNIAIVHASAMLAGAASAYVTRFAIYTTAFLPLVLPRLINFPDRKLTSLVRATVVLLYSMYWYVEITGVRELRDFYFVFNTPYR